MVQEQPTRQSQVHGINVNKLGFYLDGWADLIEDMGSKADQVRKDVLKQLRLRNMPDIDVRAWEGYVSSISRERREYLASMTDPGSVTTIYVAEHGKDLYASWRTWIEQVLNVKLLQIVGVVCGVLGFFTGGLRGSTDFFRNTQSTISITGWVTSTIGLLILAAILIAVAGRIVKGGFLAFFFIEPNMFDAEDITAMSLSVHKSLLRALDNSGIDISKLRLKRDFKGGRRGDTV